MLKNLNKYMIFNYFKYKKNKKNIEKIFNQIYEIEHTEVDEKNSIFSNLLCEIGIHKYEISSKWVNGIWLTCKRCPATKRPDSRRTF